RYAHHGQGAMRLDLKWVLGQEGFQGVRHDQVKITGGRILRDAYHICRDGLVWVHAFFQQGMADDANMRLLPQGAFLDESATPVPLLNRVPQGGGRLQQQSTLVKQGDRIANHSASLTHTLAQNLPALDSVEQGLYFWESEPAQAVEKIMQIIPRRAHPVLSDELLIGHAGRQG